MEINNVIKKERNKVENNDKTKKKYLFIILVICIIVIITISAIACFILVIYPKRCIGIIENNYNLQQYYNVSKYDSKLDLIKKYLHDDEKYNSVQYKVKISNAIKLFEEKQFLNALTELEAIKVPDKNVYNKINECKYEIGKEYIEKEEYEIALTYLEKVENKDDIDVLLDEIHCNLALKFLKEKEYVQAMEEIKKVNNKQNENFKEIKKQIHYEYGKYSLSIGNYNEGISYLEQAKDYKDANTLVNNAYIEQAEKYIKIGNLKEAKLIYDYLDEELEYNEIKVSTRKKQLNKIEGMIEATGKHYATKSYCESRNVWKYDGRWDSWYIDEADSSEYIDVSLKLNDDGTVTLHAKAYFKAFNNFSTLQEYCKANIFSRTIEIKNIEHIPSTYNIDEDTKLLFSNGKFKIEYKKKDDYSINFYNVYSTTVTY
jgi:tetratricopeptide (TPR) repeat protein